MKFMADESCDSAVVRALRDAGHDVVCIAEIEPCSDDGAVVARAYADGRILHERQLGQDRAAALLGIRQPHVSDLVRYRLNRFSVERLMDFLTRLGREVQIRIASRPAGRRRKPVHVHSTG